MQISSLPWKIKKDEGEAQGVEELEKTQGEKGDDESHDENKVLELEGDLVQSILVEYAGLEKE